MSDLAIIIPAYKSQYIEKTLASFARQDCKDFTVYIGIDGGASDMIESVVAAYQTQIDIVARRFEDNLGSVDLVGQWRRCIELSNQETWIWLFSDDDYVDEECVSSFYREIDRAEELKNIYHFNVKIIDENDCVIYSPDSFPRTISSEVFYRRKSLAQLESFVVEYIFSRQIYNAVNGFEHFDLAWGSDIATWVKMGSANDILTIEGPVVYWRQSRHNITPNKDRDIVARKLYAHIDNLAWANAFFKKKQIVRFNKYLLIRYLVFYSDALSLRVQVEGLKYAQKRQVATKAETVFISVLCPLFPFIKKMRHH